MWFGETTTVGAQGIHVALPFPFLGRGSQFWISQVRFVPEMFYLFAVSWLCAVPRGHSACVTVWCASLLRCSYPTPTSLLGLMLPVTIQQYSFYGFCFKKISPTTNTIKWQFLILSCTVILSCP